jgi:hypothetical protein
MEYVLILIGVIAAYSSGSLSEPKALTISNFASMDACVAAATEAKFGHSGTWPSSQPNGLYTGAQFVCVQTK